MSAKHRLNAAHFRGALLIAGMIGGLTESWTAFWITLVTLVIADILAGDIRG